MARALLMANPYGPNPYAKQSDIGFQKGETRHEVQYIGGLFKGTLSIFKEPTDAQLAGYSKLVYDNAPYTKESELTSQGETGNPVPTKIGDASPIKHVFYIIKENAGHMTRCWPMYRVATAIKSAALWGKNHAQPACTRQRICAAGQLLCQCGSECRWT